MRSSFDRRQSLEGPSAVGGPHRSRPRHRGVRSVACAGVRRRLSPSRLPVPTHEAGLSSIDEPVASQEWLNSPAVAEDAPQLAEFDPASSLWTSGLSGSSFDGSHFDAIASSSVDMQRADDICQASVASFEDERSGKSVDAPPMPLPASAALQDGSVEAEARGLLQRIVRRLTPSWLSPRTRGLALLWLLVALVATNWVLVKDSGGGLDPLTFSCLRFACAAAAFSPFLMEGLREKTGTVLSAGLELGLWTSAGYLTQAIGLASTDASRASFISTFTVIAVPFLAGSRLGDQREIKPVVWLCAFGALAGVSLLEQGGGSPPGMGDVWSLFSAIFFGVQIYRTEKLSRKLPPQSTFQLMSISLTFVAFSAFLSVIIAHPNMALNVLMDPLGALSGMPVQSVPWPSVLWTGLASTDLALLIELTALNTVSSIDASIIYTAEPVLGAGLAFVLLGERWGPTGWIGAAIIIASSLTAQLSGSDESSQA